jgi:phosphatidate cytidylyltransferase
MLSQRLATAAVGIPLIVLVIWVGGGLFTGVVAGAVLVGVLELQAARRALARPAPLLAAALAAALPAAAQLGHDWLTWFVTGLALLPMALLAFAREPRAAVEEWLWSVGVALYLGWLGAHFILLREAPLGRDWLFFVVLTVWAADTGAYFVGRAVGRRPMAPAISPGKTWEGAAAAELAGLGAAAVLNAAVLDLELGLGHVVALGLLVPFAGQLGDLAESALKRGLGVKDSSSLVPGHGGIADRLDSLLFAAPTVYYYLQWILL